MENNKNSLTNLNQVKKEKMDVNSTKSEKKGLGGLIETFFRSFRSLGFYVMLVPIALMYIFCMGVSLAPGFMLFDIIKNWSMTQPSYLAYPALGIAVAATYFSYGITLIFVVPLVNKLLPLKVKTCRTTWYSLDVIPWYYHNALTYLVRYTFLDFITPTPFNILFFKMMGMKIGKGTVINTSNISDPCLIELGDYVTIGGSATLLAHYGMKGFLIIDRLVIKNKATIGLRASLFGDVVIGEGATVAPHEVVMPKTRVPDKDKEAA